MTNLDARPQETLAQPSGICGPRVEFFQARQVPLGGVRGMQVQRTLPQRELPTVGAWCFLDQFGPDSGPAMHVLPHPHTGLQTVTWPIWGRIHHRDSLGNDVSVEPGELNLMTAGRGIAHSEVSAEGEGLFGLQFWAALPGSLPEAEENWGASFQQVRDLPVLRASGGQVTVFVGSLSLVGDNPATATSPAVVHTPLLGADGVLHAGGELSLGLDPRHEHALLVVSGSVQIDGHRIEPGPLAYLGGQRHQLTISASQESRFVLLGGEPFTEDLVMFWNFVGRNHEEVAEARAAWEAQTSATAEVVAAGAQFIEPGPQLRFGLVPGHGEDRIPAPQVPPVRLTPRRRR